MPAPSLIKAEAFLPSTVIGGTLLAFAFFLILYFSPFDLAFSTRPFSIPLQLFSPISGGIQSVALDLIDYIATDPASRLSE
jgi:hypothetical protein